MRGILFGLGSSAVMALLPLVAKIRIGGGPLTYGLLLGGFGIGAVIGALSNAQLRRRTTTEGIVTWSSLAFAGAAATIGLSTQMLLTLPALLIAGGSWVLALSTFNVSVQLSTPRWVVARALSLYQMTAFGGMAAGGWIWGGIAERYNVTVSLLSAAAVMLMCGLYGRWQPLSQIADLNLDPFRSFKAPATEVPIEARTGPVVVTIDYLIREEDILEFLRLMSERRRIRCRDGAHNWMLLRDLSNPQLWIERYMTPTWLDYIRLNNRMTHDDASVLQRLRAMHQGPGEPSIRRMIERQTDTLPVGHASTAHDLAEPLTDPTRSS